MNRALCMLALCAACASDDTSDDTPGGGFEGVSHVDVHELAATSPHPFDVLIILDDTAAMAPYQDRLALLPALATEAFVSESHGIQDLHIAVATTDGIVRVAPSIGGSFMTMHSEYDFTRITNFTGTFTEALTTLTSVGASRTGTTQPLAAMRQVLESNPDGFLRDNAPLGILIVSASEDASPEPPADYVRFAKGLKADPSNVLVTGITLGPSPRLDEFFTSFVNRHRVVSITDADYLPVFTMFAQYVLVGGGDICWDPPDSDPFTPGLQPECTFTAFIRDTQRLLQPCRFADDQYCWRFLDNSGTCGHPGVRPEMPPWGMFWFQPAIRIECVIR